MGTSAFSRIHLHSIAYTIIFTLPASCMYLSKRPQNHFEKQLPPELLGSPHMHRIWIFYPSEILKVMPLFLSAVPSIINLAPLYMNCLNTTCRSIASIWVTFVLFPHTPPSPDRWLCAWISTLLEHLNLNRKGVAWFDWFKLFQVGFSWSCAVYQIAVTLIGSHNLLVTDGIWALD